MRRSLRLALLLWLPLCAGCGDGGEKLVKVTGTATHNGTPVPNIAILFMPDHGLRSFALTDQDGKFNMVYNDGRDGVLIGAHKVWIELPTAGSQKDPEKKQRLATQRSDPAIIQILEKYGNADITPIRLDITESQEIDLKLD